MLAAAYPGIPNDFREWQLEEKEAWIKNIPYVLAEIDAARRSVDVKTPRGLRKSLEERFGKTKEVEDVLKQVEQERKLAAAVANPSGV